LSGEIFCSYIIPTIGRASLDLAVKSVLDQELAQAAFEVIVVNDSGIPLPKADWHDSRFTKIINTNKSERSFARNSGAAVARGEYLAFLDDDDWILSGALGEFWRLAQGNPDAVWLYGGIRIVDQSGMVLGEINSGLHGRCFAQFMGGAWAPLQASMIKTAAFFEIGGFNPLICGTEDEDLCRRAAYHGGFANTPQVIACLYRGHSWNTSTNYSLAPSDTKYSRDLILSKPGSFRRLMASSGSGYWRGRILRVYLSTLAWNIRQKHFSRALSRLLYGAAAFLLSLRFVFTRSYWAGLKADHVPETLHFVMKEYNHTEQLPKHVS
jgi:glycosyltransferase involved in cell wall biosynthesis